MVQGDDGSDAVKTAALDHASIVIEGVCRELAVFGFDAAPLDAEAIVVEAEFGEHLDVLRITVKVIAGIAAGLGADCARAVLPIPPIVIRVTAFNLMGGGRGAPCETCGE